MTTDSLPDISAILVTPDGFEPIRGTIEALRAQDVRDRIELVIVAPRADDVRPDHEALDGFHGWRVVEAGTFDDLGSVLAFGVRSARGRIVAYTEEHSFPEPGWAAALIAAHEGPWAVVGAAIVNANPESRVSWASLFLDFGSWLPTRKAGPFAPLASHQSSYNREILLQYGDRLGRLMETETVLHNDLLATGHRLYFEPAAQTRHINVGRLRNLMVAQYHNLRTFGANRATAEGWSRGRRVIYVLGSPVIPLLRAYRMADDVRRSGLGGRRALGVLPALAAGLVAGAAGEAVGYAFGKGDAARKRLSFELDRLAHTNQRGRTGALGG